MHAQSVSRQFHCKDKAAESRNLSKQRELYSRSLRRVRSENTRTRMADEGVEPIELSEASVERVAGRLTEHVAPRLLSQNPAGSSSHTTEEEGGSQKGEKHVFFYQGTLWRVGHDDRGRQIY